jgi:hypothetical protein
VAPDDVVHTYIVFLMTVLFLGVTSLFISALTSRLAVSMIVSNIVALVLAVGLSLLSAYLESYGQQGGQVVRFGPNGPITPPTPPLTPLAQIDPLVALLSALPNGTGSSLLGGLGKIYHAFGLPLQMPLWTAYSVLAGVLSFLLLLATTFLVRHPGHARLRIFPLTPLPPSPSRGEGENIG